MFYDSTVTVALAFISGLALLAYKMPVFYIKLYPILTCLNLLIMSSLSAWFVGHDSAYELLRDFIIEEKFHEAQERLQSVTGYMNIVNMTLLLLTLYFTFLSFVSRHVLNGESSIE